MTATEFKALRNVTSTAYDAALTPTISYAQGLVEAYLGRRFDSATYTAERYDGTDSPHVFLRNTPVTAVSSVALVDAAGTVVSTLDSGSYTVRAADGRLSLQPSYWSGVVVDEWDEPEGALTITDTPWPRFRAGHRNYAVTYTAGYTSQAMDPGLKGAFCEMVSFMLAANLQRIESGNFKAESLGDYSYTLSTGPDGRAVSFADRMKGWFAPFRKGVP